MRITRYLALKVLGRSAAAIAIFVAVYSAIDFVEIGSAIGTSSMLRFYPLRLPMIVAHILPLGLMIGVQTALASVRSRGEWDSLRAAGLAPKNFSLGLLIVPLLAVFFSWALLSEISPRALSHWESRIGGEAIKQVERWCKRGETLLRETDETGTALLIDRDESGSPLSYSFQKPGHNASWSLNGGWRAGNDRLAETSCGHKSLKNRSLLLGLKGASLTSKELAAEIHNSQSKGWDTAPLEAESALRPSIAAACLVIPLIALGLGLGRDEQRATRLVAIGVATAVAFWLFTAAGWNGASVGAWSPVLVSHAIPGAFLSLGILLMLVNGSR